MMFTFTIESFSHGFERDVVMGWSYTPRGQDIVESFCKCLDFSRNHGNVIGYYGYLGNSDPLLM